MKTPLLLRTASVIVLLFAVGHTLGGMESWSPPGNTVVLESMKTFRFDASGVTRSYWDFYVGFGLFISVFLLAQAVLIWQLAAIAAVDLARARPLVLCLFLTYLGCAVLSWRFIFAAPVALSLATALCLGLALLVSGRRPGA